MEIETPTFNSLNKPQRRALELRKELHLSAPSHLDSFIDGLANLEPPEYKKTNGVIKPDLVLVTLKPSATRFDLGNVIFPEDDKGVLHTWLSFENDKIEMHTGDALTPSDGSLDHIAIHGFIASSTVDLFKAKMGMILARIKKHNEARRAAYAFPTIVPVKIASGQSLERLQAPKNASDDGRGSSALKHWKREPNTPVIPHITNQRPVAGLSSIPGSLKAASFATIPEQIKIDLFNNIASTAFPNFDNLMIASWNVVSVYSACGSDFPDMHKAVVELKDVLQDFDAAFGAKVSRTPVQYRSDWAGEGQSDASAKRASRAVAQVAKSRTGVPESSKSVTKESIQQDQDTKMVDRDDEQDTLGQHIPLQDEDSESESDSGEDDIPARRPSDPHIRQRHERRNPLAVRVSPPTSRQHTRTPSVSLPLRKSPAPLPAHLGTAFASVKTTVVHAAKDADQSDELTRRRNEWASSQNKSTKHVAKKAQASDAPPPPVQQRLSPSIPVTKSLSLTKSSSNINPTLPSSAPAITPSLSATPIVTASTSTTKKRKTPPSPSRNPSPSSNPPSTPAPLAPPQPPPAKKKPPPFTDWPTPKLEEKLHTVQTEILRKFQSFDPQYVPAHFLGMVRSMRGELDRRRDQNNGQGKTEGKDKGESVQGGIEGGERQDKNGHGDKESVNAQRKHERKRSSSQRPATGPSSSSSSSFFPSTTTPGLDPGLARPVVQGMFGAYLGKSLLGAKKAKGIAPVAPMFGTTGLQKQDGEVEEGEGRTGGVGGAGGD
ncbi:hypothetical protein NX059_001854 [Plenodomus lindquistii]|nr:hypothetical protein NX059_001854 [Plenodomus lindquistii]